MNTNLLLGTGEVTATGVRSRDDGVDAVWALSWPEQRATGINPIIIRAFYSARAHHPHLQGGTVGGWALNVFDEEQAAAEVHSVGRDPQPGLPARLSHHPGDVERTHIVIIRPSPTRDEDSFELTAGFAGSPRPAH
jgi:hypothetical protein